MNLSKLTQGSKLEDDTRSVLRSLQKNVNAGMFIAATISGSILKNNGDSYISARIMIREDGDIQNKHIAFTVANGFIYSAIPLTALCDL